MRVAWLCCLLIPWVGAARLGGTGPKEIVNNLPPGSVLKPLLQEIGSSGERRNAPSVLPDAPRVLHRHRRSATCNSKRTEEVTLNGRMEIGPYSDTFKYDNDMTCNWTITAPNPGDRIILVSRAFLLEDSHKCRYDYVEIFDGTPKEANSIGKLCGRKEVRMISKSRKMTIQFKSDSSVAAPGFLFDLSLLQASSGSNGACNTTITSITDRFGTIRSPGKGSDSHYPNNATCLYSFEAPRGQIRLKFADFSLEEGSCIDDYLRVYDGYTSEAETIGTYCGRKVPRSITSSSNRLLVVFHSNSFITSTGFEMKYKQVNTGSSKFNVVEGDEPPEYDPACSSKITRENQIARSPHLGAEEYYLQKRKCRTVINPPQGLAVQVTFKKFDMEESLDCLYDHVNVTFNKKQGMRETIRLCGYQRRNSMCFLSKGGNVTLDFTSDVMFEGNGYEADYQFVAANTSDKKCMHHGCGDDCEGYCYNNGNGKACACPNGKVPPQCVQNITWKEPLRKNLTMYEGTKIKLSCAVNHPHTYTLWDKDFETSGDEVSMLPNERMAHIKVTGSNLVITAAKISDAGVYTCTVQAGEIILRQSIKLIIKEENMFCGSAPASIRNPNTNAAISQVSGKNATKAPAVIPWQVHLWNKKEESHTCGGVLISETHVLTAAHCVSGLKVWNFKASDFRVSIGTVNCRRADAVERKISRYMIHPSYGRTNLEYDFALLELDKPIYDKSAAVYPICLPSSDTWKDVRPGFKGIIAGCGKTTAEKGGTPEVLHMVDVPIANRTKCTRKVFTDDMFCAGDRGEESGDACSGDSGGGLAAQIKGRWTLLGLVSFGDGCPGTTHGYYANVSYAMDWIQKVAPICGKSRFIKGNSDDSKILHGVQALPKQFPWVGALTIKGNYACTVTLIGSIWAVTAKHCFDRGRANPLVVFGSLSRRGGASGSLVVEVEEILEGFTRGDVVLLKLKDKLEGFSDYIQPACLPTTPVSDGEKGLIAGWGQNDIRERIQPDKLMFAEFAKTNVTYCQSKYRTRLPTEICFGPTFNASIKAYTGDSGTGLITEIKDRNTLAAVYSKGYRGRTTPEGLYTDVLSLVPLMKEGMGWIEEEESCGRGPAQGVEATDTLSPVSNVIPWQVHLWDKSKELYHCGGVLISETHVLTTASCVGGGESNFRARDIRLSVGTTSCSSMDGAVKRKVSRYMLHPDFNKRTLAYDFALLELEIPINQKSGHVFPICLPKSETRKDVKAGVIAGCDRGTRGVVKMIKVPMSNTTKCSDIPTRFCAGDKSAIGSACSGFNGGAFAAEVKGRWTLVGLASFGKRCRGSGLGSYAHVYEAMEWITSVAPICGRTHFIKDKFEQERVTSGQQAVSKQFPWVGVLRNDVFEYVCPVTLIGRRWAVTSQRCYIPNKSYSVLLGSLTWNKKGDHGVEVDVLNGFTRRGVVLLKLKDKLKSFSYFIQPVCLPAETMVNGENGSIAGWSQKSGRNKYLMFAEVERTEDSRYVSTQRFNGDVGTGVVVDVDGRQTLASLYKDSNGGFDDVATNVPMIKETMGWRQDKN